MHSDPSLRIIQEVSPTSMSSLSTAGLIQWCSIMLPEGLPDPNGPGEKAECRKIAVFQALPHTVSNRIKSRLWTE